VCADGAAAGADASLVSLLECASARSALVALRLEGAPATSAADGGVSARILAAALRRCPRLASLSAARCAFDAPSWARLAAAAGEARSLTEWEAESCGLTGERCLASVAGAIRTTQCLRALNLAGNAALGDAGIGTLCDALARCATLRALVLAGCGLGEPAARALAALLAASAQTGGGDDVAADAPSQLRALDLGRNPGLGGRGGAALLDALAVNGRLEALILDGCGLTAGACARPLAAGLRENGRLRVLDLADNPGLGDAALTPALSDALWDNGSLTALDLSGSGVGDAGAGELARGLARNAGLRQLRLARCAPALSQRAAAALRAAAGRASLRVLTEEEA
jgi:hypothetical protein